MIAQGLMIMLVGMGTVFVFLGLLVGLMSFSGTIFSKWPEDEDLASSAEDGKTNSFDEWSSGLDTHQCRISLLLPYLYMYSYTRRPIVRLSER